MAPRMRARLVRLAFTPTALVLASVSTAGAHADGVLPPQPYRYLHPPAALAHTNSPPQSGKGVVQLGPGRPAYYHLFTQDTQFGVNLVLSKFKFPAGATRFEISMTPVTAPANELPTGLVPDGNGYRLTMITQPGSKPVVASSNFGVIMRWPLLPTQVEVYQNGTWRTLCNPVTWTISGSTIICPSNGTGIFLAVRQGNHVLATPSQTGRTVLIAAIVVVVLVAAALALFITRRQRSEQTQP